jgi:RHS repeat-associated protein
VSNLLNYYYFHPDHLGSSSYITNAGGTATQHMEYLPFGETLVDEHLNSFNSPFKYNGKEFDEETGNYYYGARYYDPKWSIFVSVDPLAEKTISPYGYCYNNPINLVDPTGMSADIIDIDKNTGSLKITIQEGKDIVRLVDSKNNNTVIDSYVYGENGSFNRDSQLEVNNFVDEGYGYKINFQDFNKAETFFKFAAKSNVEFGLMDFFYPESITSVATVMTTGDTGTLHSTEWKDKILIQSPTAILTYDSHSHPSEYDLERLPQPSGFNPDLTIGPLTGDRRHYQHMEKKFKGRIPEFFDVYTPSMPNVEVKYNGNKATRKFEKS